MRPGRAGELGRRAEVRARARGRQCLERGARGGPSRGSGGRGAAGEEERRGRNRERRGGRSGERGEAGLRRAAGAGGEEVGK